jgi:tyrosine-specific transport protein
MEKPLFVATATLIGFVVGAGILGLPYAFSKTGFLTGALNIIIIGLAILFLNLMIGETCLRTKTRHQLTGYIEKYLGYRWKNIMVILLSLGWYGAMIAYIIKIGEFLSALINPFFQINSIYFSVIFALIGSYSVYKGISIIKKSEFWMVFLTLTTLIVIGIFSIPNMQIANLDGFQLSKFWIPFGVVLFAFGGAGAIPEMREELKKDKYLMKHAIILGTVISALIYLLFPLFVVGVTGLNTTDGAIIGLGKSLGYKMLLLGVFFGMLTMSTSFLVVGLAMKEIFKFDYKKNNKASSLGACLIPFISSLIIILLKIDNAFYKVIDITGSLLYPLTSILLVIMFWKAKKVGERKPEYSLKYAKILGISIIILFLAGFVNELIKMLI